MTTHQQPRGLADGIAQGQRRAELALLWAQGVRVVVRRCADEIAACHGDPTCEARSCGPGMCAQQHMLEPDTVLAALAGPAADPPPATATT